MVTKIISVVGFVTGDEVGVTAGFEGEGMADSGGGATGLDAATRERKEYTSKSGMGEMGKMGEKWNTTLSVATITGQKTIGMLAGKRSRLGRGAVTAIRISTVDPILAQQMPLLVVRLPQLLVSTRLLYDRNAGSVGGPGDEFSPSLTR
jgi:hypothetical protein